MLTDEKVLIPGPCPNGTLYFHELIVEVAKPGFLRDTCCLMYSGSLENLFAPETTRHIS